MEFSPDKLRYDLPKRKKAGDSGLTSAEMDMLDMFLLVSSMKMQDIWKLVTNDKRSEALIRATSKAFLTSYDSQIYLTERKAQLDAYFKPNDNDDILGKDIDEIPKDSTNLLLKRAWAEFEKDGFDSKAAELLLKQAMKNMDIDQEVTPPLRILAEACHSCRYKAACETHLYDGCKYCKYKSYANKNGVKYTHKDQLDLPKDFYKQIKQEEK